MEKPKRWQLMLIIAVLVLTLYNILPTLFFYSKPLGKPVDAGKAEEVSSTIVQRVNQLQDDSESWLASFNHLLGIKYATISTLPQNAGLIEISFKNEKDAALFSRFLPRAGALIPFTPAQLELSSSEVNNDSTKVLVQRKVGLQLDPAQQGELFEFTAKYDANGAIAPLYRQIVYDRVTQVALAIAGPSKAATEINAIVNDSENVQRDDLAIELARQVVDINTTFGPDSALAKRYNESLSQIESKNASRSVSKYVSNLEQLQKKLKSDQTDLQKVSEDGIALDAQQMQQLAMLSNQLKVVNNALNILRKNIANAQAPHKPLTNTQIQKLLATNQSSADATQYIDLSGYHPLIKGLTINWKNSQVLLNLYDDVVSWETQAVASESNAMQKDKVNKLLINALARVAQISNEQVKPYNDNFVVDLDSLNNAQSYLVMNLGYLAKQQSQQILNQLSTNWQPTSPDFARDVYPISSYEQYASGSLEDQKFGLVVYSPNIEQNPSYKGLRNGSIYVIAKSVRDILPNPSAQDSEPSSDKKGLADFTQLSNILQQMGFIGYPGSSFGLPKEFSKDFIFELDDYYGALLQATREDFVVKGSSRFATLDFSDVEQRILTNNKINDRIQEDLLKWNEAYHAAQVDLNATNHYTVPAPTKNVYWENFKLSASKYFGGDDRKILKWGLDLSGGKTVRIGLLDQNNRPVTQPEDLKQAVNELYERINKMGVAERTIRIEDSTIVLDFPGSQNLSASDLVKASAMYFHIVNEKFSTQNQALAASVNQFLQEVWNEATVTNRKDIDSIKEIAWNHLGGDESTSGHFRPRSEHATILYDNGLRLANPSDQAINSVFNDELSSIAIFRESDISELSSHTHPLLIVFHNYALEGSNLENIQAGYDAMHGNILTFAVKSSYDGNKTSTTGNPRDDFYTWTSQFAQDRIEGTQKEVYSQGHGWRMAVILNGGVITSPTLNSPIREGGSISGRFSQREVNTLVADLKAGSLSFTPRILSEQNVSPELGQEERTKGAVASIVALVLVVVAMIGYYRFAGLVASCAVLLNIFIMWGVLQNLGAALTLPGIAGIVLTIGMAVDANVLVFERVREEFAISGRIASAIYAGYRKAFSAIIDSNITTIIAALILIQFDSGPIKGFAVTLIIGIVSSMFTALFMTRYFFANWVRNPQHKKLTMAKFLKTTHFDFLAQAKKAIGISVLVMIIGTYFLIAERKTILGMDFTGGYSLTVDLQEKAIDTNYRLETINALLDSGASHRDFEVRQLSHPNQLRIQLGTSMNEKDHPFYQMPDVSNVPVSDITYDYVRDPRLNWIVNTLNAHNLPIEPTQLATLQKNWTIMSGQFSDAMRNNAIIALCAALLAILIYITFRFEFKFAIGAVAGLIHDVIITLGILAIFHALGFPVQIDLQVIGAIMTIIGYSLNDTIIVFDRIREDMHIMRKMSFPHIINHALNVTLSRTIMTSGTTLLVLMSLVLLGGQSIFAFSLVMTIGVLVGTLSSLFIASPVMLYFHNREVTKHEIAQSSL